MGVQPIPSLLIKMSLPMMASMLVMALYNILIRLAPTVMLAQLIQALYNIVDSIFVSRISENALTAVSLVYPFQMLFISVAVGTGVGVNSLIARRLGERRQADADTAASTGQFLALVSALVFMFVYAVFPRQLLASFADDAEILDLATTYLRLCGGLCGFAIFATMAEKTIQATGDTIRPMLIQLAGAIFNIVFDPILIFGYFGFPAMGVAGAAIATVGGQAVSMVLGFVFLFRKGNLVTIRLKGFRPQWSVVADSYRVGLPSIVMQAIGSVTTFALNKILYLFTPTAVSVLGVYFKLQSFVFMPVFGLNSGAMPIMGYNFGARNKKRLMQTLKCGALYALAIMTIGLLVFQLFPDVLLALFDASDHMMQIGVRALRTISFCFPFAAIGIMLSTLFQAVGKGVYSLINSLGCQLMVLLPAAWLLSRLGDLSAVWWSFPIAEVVSLAVCLLLYRRVDRTMLKTL